MRAKYQYPIEVHVEEDGTTITFPDLPEAITGHADRSGALALATDCLDCALEGRILNADPVPEPSPALDRLLIAPSATVASKVAIYSITRARGWREADLAEALGVSVLSARELLDPRRDTRIDRLERALARLGQRLVVAAV